MSIETVPPQQNDTLKAFLQAEIDDTRKNLDELEGKIKEFDFNYWKDEITRIEDSLKLLTDQDDDQLFFLRKEISTLKENVAALGVRQKWWTRISPLGWIGLIVLPFLVYLIVLVAFQLANPELIRDYGATQTAAVTAQATLPAITETITLTPTP